MLIQEYLGDTPNVSGGTIGEPQELGIYVAIVQRHLEDALTRTAISHCGGMMQKDLARWELFAQSLLYYAWRFVNGPRTYYEMYYDL